MFQDFQERKRIKKVLGIIKKQRVIWDTSETYHFSVFGILENQRNFIVSEGKEFEVGPGIIMQIRRRFFFVNASLIYKIDKKAVGPILPLRKLEKTTRRFCRHIRSLFEIMGFIVKFSEEPRIACKVIPFPIERRGAKMEASTS